MAKKTSSKKNSKKPARKSATKKPATKPAAPKPETPPKPACISDPRIPPIGTTLKRVYKGKTIEVEIRDDGFWMDGERYNSLSRIATKLADGTPKNGILWFGLNPKAAKKPSETPIADEQAAAKDRVAAKRATRRTTTTRAGRDPAPAAAIDEPTPEPVDAPAAE